MMNISTFINMASKIPSPGQLEGLVTFMKEDEKLRFFTESYRKTGNKSYKHDAPLFAVAFQIRDQQRVDELRRRKRQGQHPEPHTSVAGRLRPHHRKTG